MTQVPYSQRPAAVPVVSGDASTPDSPAEERTGPKAVLPVEWLASVLKPEAELEFLREDDLDSWSAIAARVLRNTGLLDALVAYRLQKPIGWIVGYLDLDDEEDGDVFRRWTESLITARSVADRLLAEAQATGEPWQLLALTDITERPTDA